MSACFLSVQVSAEGHQSVPLNLAVSWRCEPTSTDLRIDFKYNGEAMTSPMALNNVQFLVPIDGGVSKLQAVLPPAAWYSLNSAMVLTTIQHTVFIPFMPGCILIGSRVSINS